jgi:non-specific serine/threonine protein kinase
LIADALDTVGNVVSHLGDPDRAAALFEESLGLFRELGDKRGIAVVLRSLVQLAQDQGDDARVTTLAEESVALFREVGDNWGLGLLLIAQAQAAVRQRDYSQAERLLQEGLREHREVGERQAIAIKLRLLAAVVHAGKDYPRAVSLWKESLALNRDVGDEPGIAECLSGLAEVAAETGQLDPATRWFAAADALRAVVGTTYGAAGLVDLARSGDAIGAVHTKLGDAVFSASWIRGRTMSLEQAIAEALALELPAPEARPNVKAAESSTDTDAAGLTRREADVLRLIAAGRTNNEIAAELVITVPTVERHVTHIYEKIGARGRADATSYALKHGFA